MGDEALSLDGLYAAIEAHISAAVPGLELVATMPHMLQQLPVPAVVIEVVEFEPGQDRGTGETALVVRFEARVIVAPEQEDCQQQAAFVAAQMTGLLRMQSWGLDVEFAEFVRAAQDWTRPELDGYAVWVVEWTQQIHLGEQEWPWPNQPPGNLVWGFSPDTGAGSEGSYLPPEGMA